MKKSLNVHFGMDDKVVGILYLSLLRDVLEKEGYALCGYPGPDSDLSDYRKRISPKTLYQVMSLSLENVPYGIGFRYGEKLNLVAADTVGQLIMSCTNLQQAFNAIKRFHMLLSVSLDIEVSFSGQVATVYFDQCYGRCLPLNLQFFLTEVMFYSSLKQARWLTGSQLNYLKIAVPYSKPIHNHMYGEVFQCAIEFDARRHEIQFDKSYLELPILTANSQLRDIKKRHCLDALKKWDNRFSIENRVKAILYESYPCFPSLEQVAERLNTSRSCLYRKLQLNNTSYQCLVNEFRREQSMALLQETDLTISEIAEELGFSDASSFRRAFKSWTGVQPSLARV